MEKIKKFLGTNLAFFIILTVAVFAIYGKTINYEFTEYDDNALITRNIHYFSEIKNIPELFKTSCYYSTLYSYYRPILNLSFAIETMSAGYNPKVYYLSNIILFILSIYLMYVFLSRLKQNTFILKFICLLIAIHPIFTSCIVWIPARNDTLLLIFLCLSFINLIKYADYNQTINVLFFFLFFAMSLFTKETALILMPLYILFLYFLKLKLTKKQIIKIIIGLLPILICYLYLRNIAVANTSITILEWNKYLSIMLSGTMTYISKFLIPDYIPVMMYSFKMNLTVIIINILFLSFLFFNFNKNFIQIRNILFAFLWLIFWLLPTFLMNDYILLFHRFLIPVIGLALIFCEFINNVILKYPVSKKYFVIIFIILFATYSYASYIQADKYKNSAVYWANAYSDSPTYHVACHGLSQRYLEIGNLVKAREFLSLAEKYSPNRYLLDIAALLLYEKNFDEAEKLLLILAKSNISRDFVYGNLSNLYIEKNDIKKAVEYAQLGYSLNKHDIEFPKLLIKVYRLNNEFEKALNICLGMLKHDRNNPQYYYTIGALYETLKDYRNALKYIEEGLKFAPENINLLEKAKSLKNMQKNYA